MIYLHDKNLPGLILLIDFERAFDSVSFKMIKSTLDMFGFGEYFCEWIAILLKDFEACVNNSGSISTRFPVKRGCQQGDPISGYLFILCIEVLAIAFKSRTDIIPYSLANGQTHLLDQYADDLSMYLKQTDSIEQNYNNINAVLHSLEQFRLLSSLKVNSRKTMLTVFGCKDTNVTQCDRSEVMWCTKYKLLGLWFEQTLQNKDVNYEIAKSMVRAIANSWRNIYVSVYGKVCVVKTLMLPKLTHIATNLPNLKAKQILEIEKIWYDYISHKKKRS